MARLRKCLWTIAAMMALPVPAAAQGETDVCAALTRLIAAGHERQPFASVAQRLASREPVIPTYAAENCEVRAGEGLFCEAPTMGRAVYPGWPDLATCPGLTAAEQVLMMDPPPPRQRDAWTRIYQAGDLWISYGVTCMLCAGAAQSRFSVGFARPVDNNQ